MSHVAKVELAVLDKDCLVAAAEEIGLEVRQKSTYNWWGHSVGDYPLPAGFTKEDLGKCQFALGVPGQPGAYEMGVEKRKDGEDGYELLWDFYGDGRKDSPSYELARILGGRTADRLRQEYSVQVQMATARRLGYSVKRGINQAGEVELEMTRRRA